LECRGDFFLARWIAGHTSEEFLYDRGEDVVADQRSGSGSIFDVVTLPGHEARALCGHRQLAISVEDRRQRCPSWSRQSPTFPRTLGDAGGSCFERWHFSTF